MLELSMAYVMEPILFENKHTHTPNESGLGSRQSKSPPKYKDEDVILVFFALQVFNARSVRSLRRC